MEDGIISSYILSFLSCFLYSTSATIFFKKTFQQTAIPTVACLAALGVLVEHTDSSRAAWFIVPTFLTICFLCHNVRQNSEWLKTAIKIDMFVAFSIAVLDLQFGPVSYILTKVVGVQYNIDEIERLWSLFRIIMTSVPQFIRKPVWLKAKLLGLRSKLGPIYILNVVFYVQTLERSVRRATFGNTAIICAVLAGLVFRPNNSATLEALGYPMKFRDRRYYHGRLMIISFLCCAVLFLEHYGALKLSS